MMHCEPCAKSFTGKVCYDQHMKSEKHIKKVKALEIQKSNLYGNAEELSGQKFLCSVCEMSFNLFSDYQIHTLSLFHASNVQAIQNGEQNSNSCIVSSSTSDDRAESVRNEQDSNSCIASSSSSDDNSDSIINENISLPSYNKTNMVESKTQSYEISYTDCKICNKHFSGPEPYNQHMASAVHKKKIEMENALSKNLSNSFKCDICKKEFSGHVPYDQHMSSGNHKKKLETLKVLQQLKGSVQCESVSECNSNDAHNASELNILKDTNVNPWYCKFCNMQCSGYVPYNQHIVGVTHLKQLKRIQIKDKLENIVQQQHITNLEQNTISQQPLTSVSTNQINNQSQKMELDYILPQGIENLKIFSVEELKLTEFLPDSKIEFDKSENEIYENSKNYKTESRESLKEIEVNEEKNYEECKLCNVQLMNKDEVIAHYESIEHFQKRWSPN